MLEYWSVGVTVKVFGFFSTLQSAITQVLPDRDFQELLTVNTELIDSQEICDTGISILEAYRSQVMSASVKTEPAPLALPTKE